MALKTFSLWATFILAWTATSNGDRHQSGPSHQWSMGAAKLAENALNLMDSSFGRASPFQSFEWALYQIDVWDKLKDLRNVSSDRLDLDCVVICWAATALICVTKTRMQCILGSMKSDHGYTHIRNINISTLTKIFKQKVHHVYLSHYHYHHTASIGYNSIIVLCLS